MQASDTGVGTWEDDYTKIVKTEPSVVLYYQFDDGAPSFVNNPASTAVARLMTSAVF